MTPSVTPTVFVIPAPNLILMSAERTYQMTMAGLRSP
jgi:hypothetical protein